VGHENASTGLLGEADLVEQMSGCGAALFIVRVVVLALQVSVYGDDSDLLPPALPENLGHMCAVMYVKGLRHHQQFDAADSSRPNGRNVARPETLFLIDGHRNAKASSDFQGGVR